jgi:hypothetical protein
MSAEHTSDQRTHKHPLMVARELCADQLCWCWAEDRAKREAHVPPPSKSQMRAFSLSTWNDWTDSQRMNAYALSFEHAQRQNAEIERLRAALEWVSRLASEDGTICDHRYDQLILNAAKIARQALAHESEPKP